MRKLLYLLLLVFCSTVYSDDTAFSFRAPVTLDSVIHNYTEVIPKPDALSLGSLNDAFQQQLQQSRMAAFREQLYEALGIDKFIPQGDFYIGSLQAHWGLVSDQRMDTLQFSVEARW